LIQSTDGHVTIRATIHTATTTANIHTDIGAIGAYIARITRTICTRIRIDLASGVQALDL
jgi:hypothetical protein